MGRVEIRVIEARNIGDVQKVGMPDPYVKVKVGQNKKTQLKYKTRVIDDCLNPVWNELFKFQIADTDSMQVRFEVWNENVIKDDILGTYAINLNALTRGVVLDTWAILTGTTVSTAELHLRILAVDFGKPTPAGVQPVTSIEQDVVNTASNQVSRPGKAEEGYQQMPHPGNPNMPPHPLMQGGGMVGGFQATPPPPQWGYNNNPGIQPAYAGPQGFHGPQGYPPGPGPYGGAPQGYGGAPQPFGGYAPAPQPYGGYGGGAPPAPPVQFAQGIPPEM